MTTPRYTQALHFAAVAHEGQTRKGGSIPYITHPVAVAALVAEYGGDEDQQIAALLHDVLEDSGPHHAPEIQRLFGARVLEMVEACTDGVPDATGLKPPWQARKSAYIAHLTDANEAILLVAGCDKVNNAQAILSDMEKIGQTVFDRFTATREETLWYYQELTRIFNARQSPIAVRLAEIVRQISEPPAP